MQSFDALVRLHERHPGRELEAPGKASDNDAEVSSTAPDHEAGPLSEERPREATGAFALSSHDSGTETLGEAPVPGGPFPPDLLPVDGSPDLRDGGVEDSAIEDILSDDAIRAIWRSGDMLEPPSAEKGLSAEELERPTPANEPRPEPDEASESPSERRSTGAETAPEAIPRSADRGQESPETSPDDSGENATESAGKPAHPATPLTLPEAARPDDDTPALGDIAGLAEAPRQAPLAAVGRLEIELGDDAVRGTLPGEETGSSSEDASPEKRPARGAGASGEEHDRREGAPASHFVLPNVLLGDFERLMRRRRARRWHRVFTGLSGLLLVVLAAQYAWFMPDDLIRRYPAAREWVAAFCAKTGCRLPNVRAPSRVRIVARDVRIHPKYEGALLVTASLVNVSPFAQPYPLLTFSLFNVNGQLITSREFEPAEYLGDRPRAALPMPPGKPVQISLELLAPEQAAVSFEFNFR